MNVESAPRGAPIDRARQHDHARGTADRPTIGAIRRKLGLPVPPPTPNLDAAGRCADSAWRDWTNAAAHLVVAGRVTCGDLGAAWAAQTLARWAADVTLAQLDALADELVADAADHEHRATTPWGVPPPGDDTAPCARDEAAA